MKILIRTDEHFSQYSSILRSRGTKYSTRLEGLIKSINWSEQVAIEQGCDMIVDLGDFFDKPELNAEELSALQEIKWANLTHKFLVGNHEMGINSLEFSSAHLFRLCPNSFVMDSPIIETIGNTEIGYLPYILELDRQPITDYINLNNNHKRIIFSHNDIKGIQMGAIISPTGFTIDEIESACDLFVNGHLHNGVKITDKIINLGNLTGQNFSENALTYNHNIMILDTNTLQYSLVENPYAFNFYKLGDIANYSKITFKKNAIVSCSCKSSLFPAIKNRLEMLPEIITYRLTTERDPGNTEENASTQLQVADHLEQFKTFILSTMGQNDIILSELNEVLK